MRCQFIGASKFRIFIRLKEFVPILDCNFPPTMVHPALWDLLGEKLDIRFDIADDPMQLAKDITDDLNSYLADPKIEIVFIENDNSREVPWQPRLQ
ncbi:hypothetical protein EVB55_032 [Rhizobium phage RHph_Y68]|uniref:Uncharacterized protein n=1 Tax=Rhizobium phage RHph_Y68 TaxID=2509787 RepID=A0A7S5QXR0_9CAUD|nr:hypothetical protein PP934_gp032 [Rhizobium phage RHph_Y68]QIG67967.1 hypothetical protein EVB55_032 [Rhizobium phage RHph_Y68]